MMLRREASKMSEITGSGLDAVRAAALTEHYQKTLELLAYERERRNKQFIVLIAMLGVTTLTAFSRPIISSLLESQILNHLPFLRADSMDRLQELTSFAGDLLLAFLVLWVFYLVANLVDRSGLIANYAAYVEQLELEIRRALAFEQSDFGFTREGSFYRLTHTNISALTSRLYRSILGCLLVAFFATRLFFDYPVNWPSPPIENNTSCCFRISRFCPCSLRCR